MLADSSTHTTGVKMMEISGINITEDDDVEIDRIKGDGLQCMIVDLGGADELIGDLRDREFDVVIVTPDCPLSVFNYYEPKVIIFSDGDRESVWPEHTVKHFFRKVPLTGIGYGSTYIDDAVGVAMDADGNIDAFGVYTFDEWDDEAVAKTHHNAVHFNMQENNFWKAREE